MYVGGLICQKTVDWSHFGSSEVIQRFCPRSQRVVATVCLFVKSGVKWHLLTNRQTVTLSTQMSQISIIAPKTRSRLMASFESGEWVKMKVVK